ncbi:YwmB family TATA-box binding protein [Paenibacillus piri]|uniref:TATA-box binding protein n=1 Tax=Paenibacillus piri TaxID=2547395 RepID=A0A4R5KN86_9BACL|nr:YwmB family TATA-box binding protein [Paenibacillus piri]TDF97113.1 hypothetical protein E1757_14840 [Paenibacillus piri]
MKRLLEYGVAVCLAAGIAGGLWAVHATAANNDIELLLPLADQLLAADRKVIIKHTGSYRSYTDSSDFERIGKQLRAQLELDRSGSRPAEISAAQGQLLYKASAVQADGIGTTLLWIGFADGTTELVISAEAAGGHNTAGIAQVQKRLSRELEAIGITPYWNVMIQGTPATAYEAPGSWLQAPLARQLHVREIGRYEDAGSVSVSYYSPQIRETAGRGEQKMNLQTAVHRDSKTERPRMTIGTPAISIEY